MHTRNGNTENQKLHPAVDEMVGAILGDDPTPAVAAEDVPELIRAAMATAIRAHGRTVVLESLTRDVALTAHRAARDSLDVAERLESFARDPHRWTLESMRDDLDAAADDLRQIWRTFDGILGGDTTDALTDSIGDEERTDSIVRGVAERFNVDPDSADRLASLGMVADQ